MVVRKRKVTLSSTSVSWTKSMCNAPEKPSMLAADRDVIAEPILRKANRSPATLELWLQRNFPIVKLSTIAATCAITKPHKKITIFF